MQYFLNRQLQSRRSDVSDVFFYDITSCYFEGSRCVLSTLGYSRDYRSAREQIENNGLSFSVKPEVSLPPSLQNIFKELQNDLGYAIPKNGDLTKLTKQGVLLLNTVLTVHQGNPNSHKGMGVFYRPGVKPDLTSQ